MIVINPSVCDSCSTSIDVTTFIDSAGDLWHFCPACRAAPIRIVDDRLTHVPPIATAVISPDGLYRYRLTRQWGRGARFAVFVMLNPSTADAHHDDPTIRRCMGFARSWGLDGIEVVNLFAFRATNPENIPADSLVARGPHNVRHVTDAIASAHVLVAAWGAWSPGRDGNPTPVDVASRAWSMGRTLYCLGTTKAGAPRHPLYLRADQPLVPWVKP